MKYTRLFVGLVVIAVTLWVLIGEQMAGASADAVVNAPVVTVRADVAGTLRVPARAPGARVAEGEVLAELTDPLVDSIRLGDLLMEQDFESARRDRIAERLAAEASVQDRLETRVETYRKERLAELRTRLEHARNRLAILEERGPIAVLERRVVDAVDGQSDRMPAEPLLDDLAFDHARERVEVLEIAVRAAQRGVFLGDGYNDSPNAEQRAVELESVIDALEADLAEAVARVAAVEARLQRERVRVNALAGGEIRSPVDGLHWEVLQADGVAVQRGDPLLRLVNCDASFVTLSVSEGIYNDLAVGQTARFRFQGDARVFQGTVSRLAGTGAATLYERLAVAPTQRHLERFDVALIVPELTADPVLGCAIGRTGRVFFDRRPLDGLRSLFR